MRVILINPNTFGVNLLPPAIGLFTALLKKSGHKVHLFDTSEWDLDNICVEKNDERESFFHLHPSLIPPDIDDYKPELRTSDVFQEFRKEIESFSPDLLAMTVIEDNYEFSIKLLDAITDFDVHVLLGGVFPSVAPEKCISHPKCNFICMGEGETALVELCEKLEKGKSYENISNLWIKKPDGSIIKNPIGSPECIDKNPIHDFTLFNEMRFYRPMNGKMYKMLPVETHRGCPYRCTFCYSSLQMKTYKSTTGESFFRKKSLEKVFEEMKAFIERYGAEAFYFWADTFLAYNKREFDQFCELYKEIRLPFYCQGRVEEIEKGKIEKLMDLGLLRMNIGIEHGNERFRRKVLKRNVSNETILEKIRILESCELQYSANNIIGFPMENRSLAMDTIDLNSNLNTNSLNVSIFTPFHGTALRELAEKMNFCNENLIALSNVVQLNMPQFPAHEIEGIRRCFMFYVKMHRSRWGEIRKAERFDSIGNKKWNELKAEFLENFL
jgi:radical SAM superfamily enzyme YgiQ (UPF0313 family)